MLRQKDEMTSANLKRGATDVRHTLNLIVWPTTPFLLPFLKQRHRVIGVMESYSGSVAN
jgi:hypothetical protein